MLITWDAYVTVSFLSSDTKRKEKHRVQGALKFPRQSNPVAPEEQALG